MTIEEMRAKKIELHLTNEMISSRSGVPLATVQKIFAGVTKTPRYHTMKALEAVFERGNSARYHEYRTLDGNYMVRESAEALDLYGTGDPKTTDTTYPFPHEIEYSEDGLPIHPRYRIPIRRQGEYTVEDVLRIPDDIRVELIDGVIYDLAAPTRTHQIIAGVVYTLMNTFAMQHPDGCQPFIAPSDVQIDNDNYSLLQPDVYVLCMKDTDAGEDQEDDPEWNTEGIVPDFVLEVLSPSTRRKDMIVKLNKYMNAGVREYWMADPEAERVIVYDFERNNLNIQYTFDDVVPVMISEGALSIDFRLVKAQIALADKRGYLNR